MLNTPADALNLSANLLSIALLVSSAEYIYLIGRGEFRRHGTLGWNIVEPFIRPAARPMIGFLKHERSFVVVILLRIALAILMLVSTLGSPAFLLAIVGLVLCQLTINERSIFGDDGSDQMIMVLTVSLTIAACFQFIPDSEILVVTFIGLQSILSYFASGSAKLFGDEWRSGTAFGKVMRNHTYGHVTASQVIERVPFISFLAGWTVILFQLSFPLILVWNQTGVLVYIAGAFSFHLGISYLMRLNGFLFAFPSAYPCLYYLAMNDQDVIATIANRIAL